MRSCVPFCRGFVMLRFDLPPVWSHVTRWESFVNFLFCGAALLWSPWLMAVPMVQGLVRGFIGHYKCPSHRVWAKLFEARGWGGKKENAGAKMFANKLLFIASAVSLLLAYLGSPMWQVPCIAVMVLTTLDWAVGFCAACTVYGLWYSKFPPKTM
ncbi:hypothetical protein CK621_09345 [Vandammella animalimorsus]|uniref:DUF4395 domain-containing protein n=2 Tax=Vandammella animalimorsus TaxID=2029117 RepID=A0A2A2AXD9_9BURK|nr:hypothetical protein CK621_09345 [Vandammella animalimorsus]